VSSDQFPELNPVFFDKKGRRRRLVNYLTFVLTAAVTILAGFFIVSVLINPFLPQLRLKPSAILPQRVDVADAVPARPPLSKKEASLRQVSERLKNEKLLREESKRESQARRAMLLSDRPAPTPPQSVSGKPMSVGFYVNWDYSSYTSLKQNIDKLDWLVPEWVRISGDAANPLSLDIDDKAMDLIHQVRPDIPILPLVQNYKNEQWNSDVLVKSVSTEEQRQKLIAALLDLVAKNNFGGLTVDIEEVPASAQTNLYIFVSELHQELQKRNLILAQAVPFDNDEWNYTAFAGVTDYLMLMGYDQHWSTGEPGPVAGNDWFDSLLKKRMKELSPSKTIVCFGSYGYDWSDNGDEAETVSFEDALITAKESLDNPEQIKFDPVSKNPYFTYDEDDGSSHTVWFLDAVSAYGQINDAKSYNVAGLALWRMGSEDPSIWEVFGNNKDASSISDLSTIKYGYDVDFDGNGEILQVKAVPHDGYRDIASDANGNLIGEVYHEIPSSYIMQRTGDQPGKIALTFDDGPDPVWTPKILDILKAENVKAAFFIVGENGQRNPELLKRIVDEGHVIGNHSFTHPNLAEVPDRVTDLELNTTQRLIESVTGRSTRLFRAPYFGDAEPRTPDEVEPTVIGQNLGYISVGLHLDPDDWKLTNDDGTPHTAEQIVDEVVQQAAITEPEERGNIVLLHDSGGDRSATVEALPKLIETLRAKGYQFTTVADLAGITPEQAMPFVQEDQSFYARTDAYFFYGMSIGGWLMRWIFLLGIVLGIGRMVVIGMLALAQYLRSRRRERIHFGESFEPLVSVVVPAYNEDKVICRTIESLLASDYPKLEIIVVDDGSADNTYQVAKDSFADNSKVTVYTKPNGGKAEALNYGWRKATGAIIIALDADTVFTPETVSSLAHRFADEKIGAIAGNAKVGNRVNVVTKWQALEYVTSQNFDRRAFSSLNCITVVPGAVGAWRRSVLEQIGGFSSETLAEDQDLTIEVRKLHYRIGYEEAAIGYTEAPDTLRNLAKQRYRWSFGTLQCMWKHKNALLNPKYGTLGFIAMPNVWIFQVLFPLISPLMDLMFIWTIAVAVMTALEHQHEYAHDPTNINQVIFYYALFLSVDWIGAFLAFLMEKSEQKKLLWWLLIQRFGYRQVMYWVMVKSVYTAIRGAIVGWGKLERKATVEVGA
jgi:cellulose synthase/poly-beta-1,6-N-acetylglucosamine synthase-like glycosyltransferase/peptidoglycan/xylan/chitin deacetylase (PgdA/CDA1 family)/spore germination protein YaaH